MCNTFISIFSDLLLVLAVEAISPGTHTFYSSLYLGPININHFMWELETDIPKH
jgi:hypothetical protein